MRADERGIAALGRAFERRAPVAEAEQQVLASVDQSVEGHDVGRGGVPVAEAQRHPHAGPFGGGRRDG